MRIIIADDQASVRSALKLVLLEKDKQNMILEVDSLEELIITTRKYCPDLVILDWELQGREIVQPVDSLKGLCSKVKIIALTSRWRALQDLVKYPNTEFISKTESPDLLLEAIDRCLKTA